MKKLKSVGGGMKTISGIGVFMPGDEKEVDDSVAREYEGIEGWEVSGSSGSSGSRKTKPKDEPPADERNVT